MNEQTLSGKVALLIGGTKGIGRATAFELAERGATVVVVGRNRAAGEAAVGTLGRHAAYIQADLSLLAEVRRLAATFQQHYDRLDLLIHTADVLAYRRKETSEGFELSFVVNYLSRFLLNGLLLDLLKASAPARIIHVAAAGIPLKLNLNNVPPGRSLSSFRGHNIGQMANDLYGVEFAKRLQGTGVNINIMNPGMVGTDIRRNSFGGDFLEPILRRIFASTLTSPEQFAQHVLRLVIAPERADWNGQLIDSKGNALSIPEHVVNAQRRLTLWAKSEALTGWSMSD